eukprot:477741-Prorocentrum_minimum.AAC.2
MGYASVYNAPTLGGLEGRPEEAPKWGSKGSWGAAAAAEAEEPELPEPRVPARAELREGREAREGAPGPFRLFPLASGRIPRRLSGRTRGKSTSLAPYGLDTERTSTRTVHPTGSYRVRAETKQPLSELTRRRHVPKQLRVASIHAQQSKPDTLDIDIMIDRSGKVSTTTRAILHGREPEAGRQDDPGRSDAETLTVLLCSSNDER